VTGTAYVLGALLAWPVITLTLAYRLNHLRRGPSFATIAVSAAVASIVWPLALVVVFVLPRAGRRS
jgi:hypothetical protein